LARALTEIVDARFNHQCIKMPSGLICPINKWDETPGSPPMPRHGPTNTAPGACHQTFNTLYIMKYNDLTKWNGSGEIHAV
jgi:hypothetical protein